MWTASLKLINGLYKLEMPPDAIESYTGSLRLISTCFYMAPKKYTNGMDVFATIQKALAIPQCSLSIA